MYSNLFLDTSIEQLANVVEEKKPFTALSENIKDLRINPTKRCNTHININLKKHFERFKQLVTACLIKSLMLGFCKTQ